MLVGMIFGAGIFVLPYAFSRAGAFWGMAHFGAAFAVLMVLHLMYADVVRATPGRHRFVGYVGRYSGRAARGFAGLITILSYWGTLLVYGLLGGIFLNNLTFSDRPAVMTIIFFICGGILIACTLRRVADINLWLTLPLGFFVLYLLVALLPDVAAANFGNGFRLTAAGDWFLPYGVWLFALSGFAVIPEVRDLLGGAPFSAFRRVVTISLVASSFLYIMFTFAVLGASGIGTTEDAIRGIVPFLGSEGLVIGSVIGFLAVFTSFAALGTDMKNIFRYDYRLPPVAAWLLTAVPPLGLFALGATDFTRAIAVIGTLGFGVLGAFILRMHGRIRSRELRFGVATRMLVWLGVFAGMGYELWRLVM